MYFTILRMIFIICLFVSCKESIEVASNNNNEHPSISNIYVESRADGTGVLVSSSQIWTRTSSFDIHAIQRSSNGSFVANSIVQWSLEGASGSLVVNSGGKSASFIPASSGLSKITYSFDGSSKSLSFNVVYNEASVLNFVTPNAANNTIVESLSYNLQWTDSDSDDDAQISFYYSSASSGQCDTGNLIVANISEDNIADNYSWDTTGISPGAYYICATIEDTVTKEEIWNPQVFNIVSNTPPSLSFIMPVTPGTNIIKNTEGITLNWTDADPEDNASIDLYLVTSTSVACNTGTLIHSTTEADPIDSYAYDTTALNSGTYYICAHLDDGYNLLVKVLSAAMHISRDCNWLGVDTDFTNTANWSNCNSVAPQSTDYLLINTTANDPVIATDTTVFGIAAGGANRDITINPGVNLTISSDQSFQSSITFKGSSTTCSTCGIVLNGNDSFVTNNSTLRLESGITLSSSTSTLDIGDGVTAGHIEIAGGVLEAEKVKILNTGPWGFRGVVLNGSAGAKSTLNVNHLVIEHYHGYSSTDVQGFHFKDNYEILGFDNIKFSKIFRISQSELITFENCSNGIFTDTDFSNFEFSNHFSDTSKNISMDTGTCSSLPAGTPVITMTNASGVGYGSVFEKDPNNLVTWFNELAYLCEWTGVVDTNWTTAGNWTNCSNGRSGYPDQFDSAYVPSGTPNSPFISENIVIQKINTPGGAGGGKITINANSRLWLAGKEILSDIIITGAPDNCTTCGIGSESTSILNNAKLTLERGLILHSNSNTPVFNVGNGVSNGHLEINPNSLDQSHWPQIKPNSYYNGGFVIEGVDAATRSSISINGLHSANHYSSSVVKFNNFYEVLGLDNMIMTTAFGWVMNGDMFSFDNCANGIFTDLNWDNLDFVGAAADPVGTNNNIDFNNCGAMAGGMINITPIAGGTNAGYGASYSNDVNNIINWLP